MDDDQNPQREAHNVTPARSAGGIVPSGDLWDEDEDDDESWMHDAQSVAHHDDDGKHDGSRGVEADDDETTEAFGSKMQRWAGTSVLGASLAGFGIAIDKVLFDRDPTQIEIQSESDDDGHLDPIQVKLSKDHPEESVAVLRPWLRDPSAETPN